MLNIIQRFGLIQGIFLMVVFFSSYLLFGSSPENYQNSELFGYSMMVVSCIAIFFATKSFRDQTNEGELRFIQGLKIGLGVSAIAAFCFALYNWIYLTWIHPTFLAEYQAWHQQQIRESGLPEAEINAQLAELAHSADLMQNTGFMLLLMFLTVFFIGALFTLVTSAALHSKRAADE